jgi:Asp-tRNA(Asn)/Glu-tRNA(Gln) amidotransferase A subunit family amidase
LLFGPSLDGCGARAGLPAVVVPGGADKDGLPIGIQVVGRAFGEETVLAMARALEREFVRIWFAVLIA